MPILKAYETILSDLDQGVPRESFESFYMAYGLFGIFLKWAKGGYSETPAEMTEIVTGLSEPDRVILNPQEHLSHLGRRLKK